MGIESSVLNPEELRDRRNASILSLGIGTCLMLVKFWGFNLTKSQAVFSDAVESIVNVVAAALVLFVVYFSAKPKDQNHPYGHGKIEYFSAAFEGGLITFAAGFIMFEAIKAFLSGQALHNVDFGILIVLGAGFANLALGLFLVHKGKKRGSIALRASGQHVISDFWTSVGVAGGLALVSLTGLVLFDSLFAFAVGAWLAWTGLKLVRESAAGLMDEEDVSTLIALRKVLAQNISEGIIQIHHVRVVRSGWYHHIDAHVVLPEFWTVKELHEKIDGFERKVISSYPFGGEMNFHFDPCRKAYCSVCDLKNCQIRTEEFKERIPIQLEDLRSIDEPKKFKR